MVEKFEQESKSLLFRGEKFEFKLSESKEESWKKSKKSKDAVKADIIDTVQKTIKRYSPIYANGVEYQKDCNEISLSVIKHIQG